MWYICDEYGTMIAEYFTTMADAHEYGLDHFGYEPGTWFIDYDESLED